jgi:hypothetical protein
MPVTTFTANVGIPVFALGFTAKNELVVGGGGGSGRTGVKNKIVSSRLTGLDHLCAMFVYLPLSLPGELQSRCEAKGIS